MDLSHLKGLKTLQNIVKIQEYATILLGKLIPNDMHVFLSYYTKCKAYLLSVLESGYMVIYSSPLDEIPLLPAQNSPTRVTRSIM